MNSLSSTLCFTGALLFLLGLLTGFGIPLPEPKDRPFGPSRRDRKRPRANRLWTPTAAPRDVDWMGRSNR